jgi:hypothetical protein
MCYSFFINYCAIILFDISCIFSQDRAYDLLADRSPLTVGSKSAGRKVAGGPADVFGRSGQKAHGGAHPRGCHCGKCWAAWKAEIAARLAARDAIKAVGTERPLTFHIVEYLIIPKGASAHYVDDNHLVEIFP